LAHAALAMAMPTGKIIGNKLKSPLFTMFFGGINTTEQFVKIVFLFSFAHAMKFSPVFAG
jgi:hypothetical protein